MVGRTGKGQHPQTRGRQVAGLIDPPLELIGAERHYPGTIQPAAAASQDHFRGTLADHQLTGAFCRCPEGSLEAAVRIIHPYRHQLTL